MKFYTVFTTIVRFIYNCIIHIDKEVQYLYFLFTRKFKFTSTLYENFSRGL